MEKVIEKVLQLYWVKWLPIIGNVFFGVLFLVKLNEYLHKKYTGEYFGNPISWYDFFANDIEIVLIVSVICSFFIKNKWIKWISVATGIIVFIIVFENAGKFNPY